MCNQECHHEGGTTDEPDIDMMGDMDEDDELED